ncbi:MAG: hypothetical protein HY538_01090 [Deltaproteobacteria bacterium]|nr:hypothetical protein [Deltaproteobacteria bacterium]
MSHPVNKVWKSVLVWMMIFLIGQPISLTLAIPGKPSAKVVERENLKDLASSNLDQLEQKLGQASDLEKNLQEVLEEVKEVQAEPEPLGEEQETEPLAMEMASGDDPQPANFAIEQGNIVGNAGVYSIGLKLAFPAGPNGMTPQLTGSISSVASNRFMGQGGDLSTDWYVERDWTQGTLLKWGSVDYFRVQLPGGTKGDLVYVAADSNTNQGDYVYFTQQAGGAPVKMVFESDWGSYGRWIAISPSGGPRFYFETVVANRASTSYSGNALRWYINRTEDSYGNKVEYFWNISTEYNSSTLRFEPLLSSVKYAYSAGASYQATLRYKESGQLDADPNIEWETIYHTLYSGSQNKSFALTINRKLQSVESGFCLSGLGCSTEGTLYFKYTDMDGNTNDTIHLQKIYGCGSTGSSVTPDDLDDVEKCLKPTLYYYSKALESEESNPLYRITEVYHPTGATEYIKYDYARNVDWDSDTDTDLGDDVVATRRIVTDGIQTFEWHSYYYGCYKTVDSQEFRGCQYVESRSVNPGSSYNPSSNNRLTNSQSSLVVTNVGRVSSGDDPLLKGFVKEEYLFNDKISGAAWNNIGNPVQKVTHYPLYQHIYCRNDIDNKSLTDCSQTNTERYGIALVGELATRTDIYDQGGVRCTSDACRQTLIQKNEYELPGTENLTKVSDDPLNLKQVTYYICSGNISESLDVEDDSALEAACPVNTHVVFDYDTDENDPYHWVRKSSLTTVYPSDGGGYSLHTEYDSEHTQGDALGNPKVQMIKYASGTVGGSLASTAAETTVPRVEVEPIIPRDYPRAGGTYDAYENILSRIKDLWRGAINQVPAYTTLSETEYNDRGIAVETTTYYKADKSDSMTIIVEEFDSVLDLYPQRVSTTYGGRALTVESSYNIGQGLLTSKTVSNSGSTSLTADFTYDNFGRLTEMTDSLAGGKALKKVGYDSNFRWIWVMALSEGNTYSLTVTHKDLLGRDWLSMVGPYGTEDGYIYTANKFNNNGQVIEQYYPKVSDDQPLISPSSSEALSGFHTTIEYDPLGRQRKVTSASGRVVTQFLMGSAVGSVGADANSVIGTGLGMVTPGGASPTYTGAVATVYDSVNGVKEVREYCDTKECSNTSLTPESYYNDPNVLDYEWRADGLDGFPDFDDDAGHDWDGYAATTYDHFGDGKYYGTYYQYLYRVKPDGSGVEALPLKIVDVHGNEINFGYDSLGRKVWMDDPDAGYSTYEYQDHTGLLTKQTDARGAFATFIYSDGQLIQGAYSQPDGDYESVSYHYGQNLSECPSNAQNTRPNMISFVSLSIYDSSEDTTQLYDTNYCYDSRGRVLERQYEFRFTGDYSRNVQDYSTKIQYTWTDDGKIKTVSAEGQTLTYEYCSDGDECKTGLDLIAVKGSDGTHYVEKITYNEYGQMKGIWYGSGRFTGYSYYPADEEEPLLKTIFTCMAPAGMYSCDVLDERVIIPYPETMPDGRTQCESSNMQIQNLEYFYRPEGNIYKIISHPSACYDIDGDGFEDLNFSSNVTIYEYDGLNRLLFGQRGKLGPTEGDASWSTLSGPGDRCVYDERYSYDMVGNMRTKKSLCNRTENGDELRTKYSWTFNYIGGTYGPHQLSSVSINNPADGERGLTDDCSHECCDGSCTVDMEYDETGNMAVSFNPHIKDDTGVWVRNMTWTPRGQMRSVSYAPDNFSSAENYTEALYDPRNLRYFKYQPRSVKTSWGQDSDGSGPDEAYDYNYTLYVDKFIELGVRDLNIDNMGTAIQVPYANLHIFAGGFASATGEIAAGSRRIATFEFEDFDYPHVDIGGCSGEATIVSGGKESANTWQLLFLLLPLGFVIVLRRRRRS